MAQTPGIESSKIVTMPPPKATQGTPAAESAGVENLIGRLRDEGIAQGRSQAEALVTAAQQHAADLVATAQREAEALLIKATEEAAKLKAAGEDAIRLAMRDTILSLEGDLLKVFQDRLRHLVQGVLADPAFLQRLILEVASRAAPAPTGARAELLLPAELVALEDLRRTPEEARPGTLMHFVLSLGGGMLRDGMSFGVADDGEAGIRVRLVDDDVQIELTESALSDLLLRHMLPRFRALLRGAVVVKDSDTKQPEAAVDPSPARRRGGRGG
jgi:V/A-type H+/Na+-transporting ATPase subunit E